jgi:hypothetical protein
MMRCAAALILIASGCAVGPKSGDRYFNRNSTGYQREVRQAYVEDHRSELTDHVANAILEGEPILGMNIRDAMVALHLNHWEGGPRYRLYTTQHPGLTVQTIAIYEPGGREYLHFENGILTAIGD